MNNNLSSLRKDGLIPNYLKIIEITKINKTIKINKIS